MSAADDALAAAASGAALAAALAGPAEVSGDAGSVRQQPLPDLIEADKYQRAKVATARPGRGLRFTRLIPPGTT